MPPMGSKASKMGASKPKNIKQTIRDIVFYYRDYKKMFIVSIVLALIGGIAATAAILINGFLYSRYIIPSVALINSGDYALFGLFSFIWFCVGIIVTYIISNGFNWLESYILLKMSESGSYSLRDAVFKKLNQLPISYFDRVPSGDIMSRSINDVDNIGQTLSQYLGNIVY
jgi:ATP-binding cassette subfamily B protein